MSLPFMLLKLRGESLIEKYIWGRLDGEHATAVLGMVVMAACAPHGIALGICQHFFAVLAGCWMARTFTV